MRVWSVLTALVAAPILPAADNWPEFRGPHGNGVADAKSVPTKWGEGEAIRWKTPIHDKGWSSPVVWGEQVWVTTAHENGKAFFAVCLERKSGKVLHDLHLFDEPNPPKTSQYNSFASPTPAIEEGRVYVHFGSFGTACLDTATGKELWRRTDLPCNHFRNPASSPVLYRDWLYLTFDGFDRQYVACLNKLTGKTVWQKDRTLPYKNTGKPELDGDYKKAYATPSILEIDGRPQLVSPAAMGTVSLDPATGDEIWRVVTDGMNQASRPLMAHGLVFVTAGHTSSLFAIRAGGSGDLTKSQVAWKLPKGAPTRPSLVAAGDLLFFVNDTGVAYCLEAATGKEVWRETLGGKFSASPVLAGGNVYFFSEEGKGFVVIAERTFKLLETNKLDAGCRASPAAVDGALFVRTLTHLYCIGK